VKLFSTDDEEPRKKKLFVNETEDLDVKFKSLQAEQTKAPLSLTIKGARMFVKEREEDKNDCRTFTRK
jgi:hypothetical protein